MSKLVIVESPTKARKIWGILKGLYPNESHDVESTIGHLVDLPKKEFAIRMDADFEASFVVTNVRQHRHLVAKAQIADEIFLASDPDREGEAISRYMGILLQQANVTVPMHRIHIREITKKGIKTAMDNPTGVDMALCEAQLARRILDRIIGFGITPGLWNRLNYGMVVGRVQTFAVSTIVKRERERRKHKSTPVYVISANVGDTKCTSRQIGSNKTAYKYRKMLRSGARIELRFSEKDDVVKPRVPYTTSSILQDGSRMLAFSSNVTMDLLQKLFEAGLITYHRTDSIRMNPGFCKGAREFIVKATKNRDYIPTRIRFYPGAGAHEAIRPTKVETTPSKVGLTKDANALYRLIWARAVSTQASNAKVKRQILKVVYVDTSGKTRILMTANGWRSVFDGWMRVSLGLFHPWGDEIKFDEKKDTVDVASIKLKKGMSQPVERWTEARLIKFMEEVNVGRPSTYASIMGQITKNRLVSWVGGGRLMATRRGELLIWFLEQIPELDSLLSESFTSSMESDLDALASGSDSLISAYTIVAKCWQWLESGIDVVYNGEDIDLTATQTCPDTNEPLVIAIPRKGDPFLATENKKNPKYYGLDFHPTTDQPCIFEKRKFESICPACKTKTMFLEQSKYGPFVRCTECNAIDKKARI